MMIWWKRLGLRAKIMLTLGMLALVTLAGGLTMIWYTLRMEALFAEVVHTEMAALEAAEELELALIRQKGLVSYYLINGDENWLVQLDERRREFKWQLEQALVATRTEEEARLLKNLATEYAAYVESKNRVIDLYKKGERETGSALHESVRKYFVSLLDLCDEYKELHKQTILNSLRQSARQAHRHRLIAGATVFTVLTLSLLLSVMLVRQVLNPIQRLAQAEGSAAGAAQHGNELANLDRRVHGLIDDADQARLQLAQSREKLLQSERMAVLGKLAADVAHSIRNPMTSIKMRLFSLERSLGLTPNQQEDFAVVSEEMRRLDNIVRNFLEFSRPHKLRAQELDISATVDLAVQLLEHQLERGGVKVLRHRAGGLPPVSADKELLKEVLVNLMVNACDAMPSGGQLTIHEEAVQDSAIGAAVRVRLADTGPGIPAHQREEVFKPFFSTKESGTGLGMPIASRIVEEHGGRLELEPTESMGAVFAIVLPVLDRQHAVNHPAEQGEKT